MWAACAVLSKNWQSSIRLSRVGAAKAGRAHRLGARRGRSQPLSMAGEVVLAERTAKFRPAFHAPIVHQAGIAHERLETFRLAHRRVGWMPQIGKRSALAADLARLDRVLISLERPFGQARIKIDKIDMNGARNEARHVQAGS